MADNEMVLKLSGDAAGQVRALSSQFNYNPTEIVLLGLRTVELLMRQKELGNKFFVATAEGKVLQEWELPEPQASVDNQAQQIIENAFPTSLQKAIADLDPDYKRTRRDDSSLNGLSR